MNGKLNWYKVLTLLEVAPRGEALPAITRCPLCRKDRLYTYQDNIKNGPWHHCRDCSFAGDTITLASATWKVNLPDAIGRLNGNDAFSATFNLEELNIYDEDRQARLRIERLWEKARSPEKLGSERYRELIHKLQIRLPSMLDSWKSRLGRFLGIAYFQEVADAYRPRARNIGKNRLFCGGRWKDVALIPVYDLPGRIRGFYILGRDMKPEDKFYRAYNTDNRAKSEPGFAMLDAVTGPTDKEFGDTVFLLNDIEVALRIHEKHFLESTEILPVVGTMISQKNALPFDTSWLDDRKKVFWSDSFDRFVLREAIQANGRLATNEDVVDEPFRQIGRLTSRQWLRRIENVSLPWTQFLGKKMQTMSGAEAKELFDFCEMSVHQRNQFYAENQGSSFAFPESVSRRTLQIHDKTFEESEGCWWGFQRNRKILVSDAILRLDRSLLRESTGVRHYQGRVLYKGKEHSFLVRAASIDSNPIAWLAKFLQNRQLGFLEYNNSLRSYLLPLTLKLNPPTFGSFSGQYGWSEDAAKFLFQDFTISGKGEVVREVTPMLESNFYGARDVSFPEPFRPEELDLMAVEFDSRDLIWATVMTTLDGILSVMHRKDAPITFITGQGAMAVCPYVLSRLGCEEFSRPQISNDWPQDFTNLKNWPSYVRSRLRPFRGLSVRPDEDLRNKVIPLVPAAAFAAGLSPGFTIIHSRRQRSVPQTYAEILRKLVPNYLSWAGQNGALTLPASQGLRAYHRSLGLPHLMMSTKKVVSRDDPASYPYRFARLIKELERCGYLQTEAISKRSFSIILDRTAEGHVILPRDVLAKQVQAAQLRSFDLERFDGLLYDAEILQERTQNGPLVLRKDWWEKSYSDARFRKRKPK